MEPLVSSEETALVVLTYLRSDPAFASSARTFASDAAALLTGCAPAGTPKRLQAILSEYAGSQDERQRREQAAAALAGSAGGERVVQDAMQQLVELLGEYGRRRGGGGTAVRPAADTALAAARQAPPAKRPRKKNAAPRRRQQAATEVWSREGGASGAGSINVDPEGAERVAQQINAARASPARSKGAAHEDDGDEDGGDDLPLGMSLDDVMQMLGR